MIRVAPGPFRYGHLVERSIGRRSRQPPLVDRPGFARDPWRIERDVQRVLVVDS